MVKTTMSADNSIELNLTDNPSSTVIWLHGLGDSGEGLAQIVPFVSLGEQPSTRFIFANAPFRPVTINGGATIRAWYDVTNIDFERQVDPNQLDESYQTIAEIIDNEIKRGIDSERIVIAGFSQGAAMSLEVAIRYNKPLAAILAMSGYLIKRDKLTANSTNNANLTTPIALHHGVNDDVVPEALGRRSVETLQKMGYSVSYQTYNSAHNLSNAQLADVSNWLKQVLQL